MLKHLFSFIIACGLVVSVLGQNTTILPSRMSAPRLSYEAIIALSAPQQGDMVYDLTFNCLRVYNGSKWVCSYQTPNDPTPNMAAIVKAGGMSSDQGVSIATDGSGNVYVTGLFNGTATFGAMSITSAGGSDIFVAKYNSEGIVQWVQKAGGMNNDEGLVIATDGSGNVYVTGFFNGTATFGATPITSAGGDDIFVVKYNSGGIFQWVQKGGGTSSEWGQGIATDGSGNVYVTGFFNGTATFGATPITSAGSLDIFVVKYNSGGSFQWVQKAGGTGSEQGLGIATDGSGNVYVTGLFNGTATFGATPITSAGGEDIFVAKYSSGGIFQWVQKAGGTSSDVGGGIAIDGSGNVYVTGYFAGTATFGATSITSAGSFDIFVAKYNSGGTFQWVQQAGGTNSDVGGDIATDGSGNVYVAGFFNGTATFGATPITSAGGNDIFVTKYNSGGTFQWVQKGGGTSSDVGGDIATDSSGNIYVIGYFAGTATFGATSISSVGSFDIFVARVQE